jgi:heme exporter protein CcmD
MESLGRYAVYILPAYGISAVVLAALVIEALLRARRWRKAAGEERPKDAPQ